MTKTLFWLMLATTSMMIASCNEDESPSPNDLNPVAKYTFDMGNANDEEGTNHAEVIGATLTTDRAGNAGKAYAFDGVNDYLNCGTALNFDLITGDNTGLSISVWAKSNYTFG